MNRQVLFFATILSTILVLTCAGCSELPVEGFETGPNGGGGDVATQTPTPTPQWVEEATPIRTQAPQTVATASYPTPGPTPILPVYTEIYSNKVYLLYDVIALNFDLKVPAMIIDLEIDPEMYTNTKRRYSDFGDKGLITITESYPDPRADFIITIIDRETGDVVEEHDYAQFTREHETDTIIVRYPGDYQVEITGNNVDVGITISVPEANLVDGAEEYSLS